MPAMALLIALADVAASSGGRRQERVCDVRSPAAERRVVLGQHRMDGKSLFMLACASERAFQPGLLVSVAE
jgi:hypothetical protein